MRHAPACGATPWRMAFSTSGWRRNVGTGIARHSSSTRYSTLRRSAKRACCRSTYRWRNSISIANGTTWSLGRSTVVRIRSLSPSSIFSAAGLSRSLMSAAIEFNRSEEHTSELQSLRHLVCRLLLEKKKQKTKEKKITHEKRSVDRIENSWKQQALKHYKCNYQT